MTTVISFNSVIFMLNNYIAKHFLSIGYWYWVLVLPGTNNIGYWVLGGFLGIVLTLVLTCVCYVVCCGIEAQLPIDRVPTHPGKSWIFFPGFSRPRKVLENQFGPGKCWK